MRIVTRRRLSTFFFVMAALFAAAWIPQLAGYTVICGSRIGNVALADGTIAIYALRSSSESCTGWPSADDSTLIAWLPEVRRTAGRGILVIHLPIWMLIVVSIIAGWRLRRGQRNLSITCASELDSPDHDID